VILTLIVVVKNLTTVKRERVGDASISGRRRRSDVEWYYQG
jgi:hypothetical protein